MTNPKQFRLTNWDLIPFTIWLCVFFLTWLFMHGADHFLEMTPAALGKYFTLRYVLIAHITTGGGALITGIIQFWPKLRNFSLRLHRAVGYLYLLCILISSFCAMILALTTAYKVSWSNAFTLQIWAGVWITSTFIAFYSALRKRFQLHKEWMIRSYIVTVAFLISGFAYKLPFFQELGKTEDVGTPLFWMGWSVPLFLYEIVRSGRRD